MIFSALRRLAIFDCDPGEARTLDPVIKSHLLYQLSYGVIFFIVGIRKEAFRLLRCKVTIIFLFCQQFC